MADNSKSELPLLWKKIQVMSSLLASLLIPIVIGILGQTVNKSIQDNQLGLQYVDLALEILKEEPTIETSNLRKWAIQTVDYYAEVKLSDKVQNELQEIQLGTQSTSILLSVVKAFEGLLLRPYKNSEGLDTIGFGYLITDNEKALGAININGTIVNYSDGITEKQAEFLLNRELEKYRKKVAELIMVEVTEFQLVALISFAYSIGVDDFEKSSVLTTLNQNQREKVPTEMTRYIYDDENRVIAGLQRRRAVEVRLWNGELLEEFL